MSDLISALKPREASAAVIPKDAQSQSLLRQISQPNSPYAAVTNAAQDDPRAISLYHMNPKAEAALGKALGGSGQLWGATVMSRQGGGRPEVYVTPTTSSMFDPRTAPNHTRLGKFVGEAPTVEHTTGHELGHVMSNPVAVALIEQDARYKILEPEILADLVATNPTTPELKETIKDLFPSVSRNARNLATSLYGDALHGSLGTFANVLVNEDRREQREGRPIQSERVAQVESGNIDLFATPEVKNPDGSTSTVRSMSFQDDAGVEVLIPTVVNGRVVSDAEAIRHYQKTGKHLGKFRTPEEATKYAIKLHEEYEQGKYKKK